MIDIYIDDVEIKTIDVVDGKHRLIAESDSHKIQLLLDDEEFRDLYILSKNRCETSGLIPIYNHATSKGGEG